MNSKFALIILLNKLGVCKNKFEYTYSYKIEPIFVLGQFTPVEIAGHGLDLIIKKCK
jgi:hypothetical protein